MWNEITRVFNSYMGTGLIVGWFLICVVYLLVKEKQKHIRILFINVPLILLVLFFTPIFAQLVYRFADDEIYYRILWLIPVTVVIAYTMTRVYMLFTGKKRIVFLAVGSALIMLSGSLIYGNPYFRRAQNLYHMPREVVDICDAIIVEGREVMAVFPAPMLQYVRQYTPFVHMPYGREIIVERWGFGNELYTAMEAEVIEVEKVVPLARGFLCHYVILPQDKEVIGDFTEQGYVLFDSIGGYDIYLDTTLYIGL